MKRRDFCRLGIMGLPVLGACRLGDDPDGSVTEAQPTVPLSGIFWIKGMPIPTFTNTASDRHAGFDALVEAMGEQGLPFYRSGTTGRRQGPRGLIDRDDVVLIKVNAQWKYRGCTNSDLVRGIIRSILDHPDGFIGEVVIIENGQGRGSLNCDTAFEYEDDRVHANAEDGAHSFLFLVNRVFADARVGARLLDSIRTRFIGPEVHDVEGYRSFENVSYPCFNTPSGQRVELREGIWTGTTHRQNLKLINVPVLKHHGGSEWTASLKHMYGVLSMGDGQIRFRHYSGLGETCGKMFVSVRQPVLNILDATWVAHASLKGFPEDATTRMNQILASQDPVALDYWAAKHILHPIDGDPRHDPDFERVRGWLDDAMRIINDAGGLFNASRQSHEFVTRHEEEISVFVRELG